MKELRIKCKISDKRMPLATAIENGYVIIDQSSIRCVNGELICATGICDKNNQEIYTDDTLVDRDGNQYCVVVFRSSVLLKSKTESRSVFLGNFNMFSFNNIVELEILD